MIQILFLMYIVTEGRAGLGLFLTIAELGSTLLSLYYRKRYTQVYQYA